jgi:hypothetical protein
MKYVLIKSSLLLFLLLSSCKRNETEIVFKKNENKEVIDTTNLCILEIKNDSVILKRNIFTHKMFFKSSAKLKYILSPTSCIDEDSNWGWDISFSSMKKIDNEKAMLNIHKKYKNIDFDFILYQSRNDEFFLKIKNDKLYLVAYKYSISNLPTPIVKIKNGVHTEIGEKETTKEKIILLNILVTKAFNTDFVCKYRSNDKKYPFKIIINMNYNKK